jgi:aarF domain-containing kinase
MSFAGLCRLAKLGSQTMLQMMLVDNLIHSDLHPGNILVAVEPPRGPFNMLRKVLDVVAPLGVHLPARWLQPHIVLLDVGAFHLTFSPGIL